MSHKLYCDRCKEEFFRHPTVKVAGIEGGQIYDLCEKCAVELQAWVKGKQ